MAPLPQIMKVRLVCKCTHQTLWGGAWERFANVQHTYVNKSKHFPGGIAASLFIVNSPHTHKGSHPLINMQRLQGAIIHSPTFQHLTVLTGCGSACLLPRLRMHLLTKTADCHLVLFCVMLTLGLEVKNTALVGPPRLTEAILLGCDIYYDVYAQQRRKPISLKIVPWQNNRQHHRHEKALKSGFKRSTDNCKSCSDSEAASAVIVWMHV